MLKHLRRFGIVSLACLTFSALPAAADDQVVDDPDDPGVDIILTDPGEPAGNDQQVGDESGKGGGEPLTITAALVDFCAGKLSQANLTTDDILKCVQADADTPTQVDAASLARKLRDRLDLANPQLHTSPEAPVKALVGLETWLWVPKGQWQPLRESAALGDTTVTVTATPVQTRWDMGESTKACGNPGRAWRKGLGQNATTPCGYTYRHTSAHEPGDKYHVSAVLRYHVTWTCGGDCSEPGGDLGTLDSNPDTAGLEVSERQSVVINR